MALLRPPAIEVQQSDGLTWLRDGDTHCYVARITVGSSLIKLYFNPRTGVTKAAE